MSANVFNHLERLERWRTAALVVAAYTATFLLFSYRSSRITATECVVIHQETGYCALEHRLGDEPYQTPWRSCDQPPRGASFEAMPSFEEFLERKKKVERKPCFYYVNRPNDIFLEPRTHRWATPTPLALLALGSLGAAFAQAWLVRAGRRPKPAAANDAGPYRRAAAPERRPLPAPLAIALTEHHWADQIIPGIFFFLGTLIFALMTYLVVTSNGNEITPFFFVTLFLSHLVLVPSAFGLFFARELSLSPTDGLLVYLRRLGPFRWQRAYELDELKEATHRAERLSIRALDHFLVVERPTGEKALRWRLPNEEAAQRHAAALNAFLTAWHEARSGFSQA